MAREHDAVSATECLDHCRCVPKIAASMAEKSSVKENTTPLKTPATLSRRRSAEKGPAAVYEGSGSQRRRESRFRGTNQLIVPESVNADADPYRFLPKPAPRAARASARIDTGRRRRSPIQERLVDSCRGSDSRAGAGCPTLRRRRPGLSRPTAAATAWLGSSEVWCSLLQSSSRPLMPQFSARSDNDQGTLLPRQRRVLSPPFAITGGDSCAEFSF